MQNGEPLSCILTLSRKNMKHVFFETVQSWPGRPRRKRSVAGKAERVIIWFSDKIVLNYGSTFFLGQKLDLFSARQETNTVWLKFQELAPTCYVPPYTRFCSITLCNRWGPGRPPPMFGDPSG